MMSLSSCAVTVRSPFVQRTVTIVGILYEVKRIPSKELDHLYAGWCSDLSSRVD